MRTYAEMLQRAFEAHAGPKVVKDLIFYGAVANHYNTLVRQKKAKKTRRANVLAKMKGTMK